MVLSPEEKQQLINLYVTYISQYDPQTIVPYLYNLNLIKNDEGLLDKLSISLTIQEIKEIFQKTGLLVLRPPHDETKLLVACGNNPVWPGSNYGTGEDEHAHEDFYTVDPDLLINPSVIAFFGKDNDKLKLLFEYFNTEKFHDLYFEASNPIAKEEEIKNFDYSFLIDDFKVYDIQGHKLIAISSLREQSSEVFNEVIKGMENVNLEGYPSDDNNSVAYYSSDEEHLENYPSEEENNNNASGNNMSARQFCFFKPMDNSSGHVLEIIQNDDINQFSNEFHNANAIEQYTFPDGLPMTSAIVKYQAWHIFHYICEHQVDLSESYQGNSIEDGLKLMIDHDYLSGFKEMFTTEKQINNIKFKNEDFITYINNSNASSIKEYIQSLPRVQPNQQI